MPEEPIQVQGAPCWQPNDVGTNNTQHGSTTNDDSDGKQTGKQDNPGVFGASVLNQESTVSMAKSTTATLKQPPCPAKRCLTSQTASKNDGGTKTPADRDESGATASQLNLTSVSSKGKTPPGRSGASKQKASVQPPKGIQTKDTQHPRDKNDSTTEDLAAAVSQSKQPGKEEDYQVVSGALEQSQKTNESKTKTITSLKQAPSAKGGSTTKTVSNDGRASETPADQEGYRDKSGAPQPKNDDSSKINTRNGRSGASEQSNGTQTKNSGENRRMTRSATASQQRNGRTTRSQARR